MKILVVCQYYYPENFQINEICEQLVAEGYDVTVLTGLPNYPTGIVPDEYLNGKKRSETHNGVHIIRCNEISRRKGAVNLAKNYLSFYFSSMSAVKGLPKDYGIVFVYQLSPILMGLPAKWYAKKHKRPLLLYCCDLWPESMKMYIKNENNPIYRIVGRISKSVYSSCDIILVQSKSFISYLCKTHELDKKRVSYLPAFADEKYLSEDFSPINNGTTDFVFLGNIGIAQNLSAVIQAFDIASHSAEMKLHIVGDGSCLKNLKEKTVEMGIENKVIFYGRRPVDEMTDFYKLADACLVSLNADNATGLTLPSKVQGYMAAGKPIIGMIDGSAKEAIEESGCGICVSAGDIKGLAEAMIDFSNNRNKYMDCGRNGREYFKEHFKKDHFISALETEFKSLERRNEYI